MGKKSASKKPSPTPEPSGSTPAAPPAAVVPPEAPSPDHPFSLTRLLAAAGKRELGTVEPVEEELNRKRKHRDEDEDEDEDEDGDGDDDDDDDDDDEFNPAKLDVVKMMELRRRIEDLEDWLGEYEDGSEAEEDEGDEEDEEEERPKAKAAPESAKDKKTEKEKEKEKERDKKAAKEKERAKEALKKEVKGDEVRAVAPITERRPGGLTARPLSATSEAAARAYLEGGALPILKGGDVSAVRGDKKKKTAKHAEAEKEEGDGEDAVSHEGGAMTTTTTTTTTTSKVRAEAPRSTEAARPATDRATKKSATATATATAAAAVDDGAESTTKTGGKEAVAKEKRPLPAPFKPTDPRAVIFVGSLPLDVDAPALREFAERQGLGSVRAAHVEVRNNGKSAGFGYLELDSSARRDAVLAKYGMPATASTTPTTTAAAAAMGPSGRPAKTLVLGERTLRVLPFQADSLYRTEDGKRRKDKKKLKQQARAEQREREEREAPKRPPRKMRFVDPDDRDDD